MNSVYNIRELQKGDYAQYYPLICEFRETIFSEEDFISYMDALPSCIKIYVLFHKDTMIATTTVLFEPKLIFNMCTFAHIEDVCVLKKYQKSGIGSKLLQHVIEEARNRKCYKITLVCNEGTSPFYLKNGFERRGIQCSMLLEG